MVVADIQDYIAAGQFRGGEQLIDPAQVTKPGTLIAFLEPPDNLGNSLADGLVSGLGQQIRRTGDFPAISRTIEATRIGCVDRPQPVDIRRVELDRHPSEDRSAALRISG